MQILKKAALAGLLSASCLASAQVPTVPSAAIVVDTWESIGAMNDLDVFTTGLFQVVRKVYTVPAGRVARLTDMSVDPRNANTSPNPCFFEIWRGNDTQPLAQAWNRVRIFSTSSYDRTWVTPPQFSAGESIWVIGRFDPNNTGIRLCARNDPAQPTELRWALRGYVARALNP